MENNSRLVTDLKALRFNYSNPAQEEPEAVKPSAIKPEKKAVTKTDTTTPREDFLFLKDLSQNKLQEALIWSEVLGKPLSKRGKRR